jgi:hypothetical protein
MKVFSDTILAPNGTPVFALYVDSEITGDQNKDVVYAAVDLNLLGHNDPDQILSHLVPMLTELVYTLYGEKPERWGKKEPLTQYSNTGFDPKYPNGVNTGIYDK